MTHNFFSLGVCLYLLYRIDRPPTLLVLLLSVWLVFATNEVIDILGHVKRNGIPARSFLTHSIFTAPLWGIAVAVFSVYVTNVVVGQTITSLQTLFFAGLAVIIAYSHLLLDAITEGGVFFGRHRIALAHMRYNNPILNGAFAVLGLMLVFVALA